MTPQQAGDLAERLLPIAAGLACIAHGDGDQRDIAHVLRQLDAAERDALIVVLAGLVNPDTVVADALGYLTWDEHGRPAAATAWRETLRDIAVHRTTPSGVAQQLVDEQKAQARARYRAGQHQNSIARDLGVHVRTVVRWCGQRTEVAA